MVASSIILQNVLYLAGAVALIIVLSVAVTLRHRRPTSVESHMETFNRGLQALAPDVVPSKRRSRPDRAATLPPPARPSYRPSAVQPYRPGAAQAEPGSPDEPAGQSSIPTNLEAETG